jgi:hypothetical protein
MDKWPQPGYRTIEIPYTRISQRIGSIAKPVIFPRVCVSDDPGTGMERQAATLSAQRFKRKLDSRMIK